MIVCICHRINDKNLDAVIASGSDSAKKVFDSCGARGPKCNTCLPMIEERIASHRQQKVFPIIPFKT